LEFIKTERRVHLDLKKSGWIRWIAVDDYSENESVLVIFFHHAFCDGLSFMSTG